MWCLRRKGEALRLVDRLGAKGLQMQHDARCIRVVAQVQESNPYRRGGASNM